MNRLNTILSTLFLIVAFIATGQEYVVDSVCVGAIRNYRINGEKGSTYEWFVKDTLGNEISNPPYADFMVVTSPGDTTWGSEIIVTWNDVGVFDLSTLHYSVHGCDTVEQGRVFVYEDPLVFAGNDTIICLQGSFAFVNDSAVNYSRIEWSTSGDGTFDNISQLHPVYVVGSNDAVTGSVTLTLTGYGLADNGTCPVVESKVEIRFSNSKLTLNPVQMLCFNDGAGAVNATVVGGIEPYKFSWVGPSGFTSSGSNISVLESGEYTLTVTDSIGCIVMDSIEITEPDELLVVIDSIKNVTCFEGKDGTARVVATGGTGSYTYQWNTTPQQNSALAINLTTGQYIVTVTDTNGCVKYDTVNIAEPTPLVLSSDSIDSKCGGKQLGSIDLTVSGGTPFTSVPHYLYEWHDNTGIIATTEDITNLVGEKLYWVYVTDSLGCTDSLEMYINEEKNIQITLDAIDSILCYNELNGMIDISVKHGKKPYTYLWNTGATSEDLLNIPPGFYRVVVNDKSGCDEEMNFTLLNPDELLAEITPDSVEICEGTTLQLNGNPTGGTGSFTHLWSGTGAAYLARTDTVAPVFAGTSVGMYNLIYKVTDENNCVEEDTVTIIVNPVTMGSYDTLLCAGELPFIWNDSTYTAFGTYINTITNVQGCDSVITLNVIELPATTGTYDTLLCAGELPFIWNDSTYTAFGTYINTITNVQGCDSVITLNVIELPEILVSEQQTICANELPYTWFGQTFTSGDTIVINVPSTTTGCDTIRTLQLKVNPEILVSEQQTICANELPYTWFGQTFTSGDTIVINVPSTTTGCDTIRTLQLKVNPEILVSEQQTICANELPYTWFGQTFTSGDTIVINVPSTTTGCDTIRTLQLKVNPEILVSEQQTICANELPYTWFGQTFTSGDTIVINVPSTTTGCDTIRTLQLKVNPEILVSEQQTICANELPYTWFGQTFTSGDTIVINVPSTTTGCDTIRTLQLKVNPEILVSEQQTICANELPYTWFGQTFTSGDTIVINVPSTTTGCDTIRTLQLKVNPEILVSEQQTICANELPYTWFGQTFTSGDTIVINVPSTTTGCDTIRTLQLKVNPEKLTTFSPIVSLLQFSIPPALPTTSNNGITGIWSGIISTNNPGFISFKFTPNSWECASPFTMSIEIIPAMNTIICPPDSIVECFADVPAAFTNIYQFLAGGGKIDGGCTIDSMSFTLSKTTLSNAICPQELVRTYSISIQCGPNDTTISCDHKIIIQDKTLPQMVCPDTLYVEVGKLVPPVYRSLSQYQLLYAVTDNCGLLESTWTFRSKLISGTTTDTIIRNYAVADSCGLTVSCEHIIIVNTDAHMAMNCPVDTVRVECFTNVPPLFTNYTEYQSLGGSAFSLCGINTGSFRFISQASNGANCPKYLTRLYEISDNCGNLDTCKHIIEIWDKTAPVITCPPDLVVTESNLPAPYASFQAFITANGKATDNCGIELFVLTAESEAGANPKIISRTYSVTDSCGNFDECAQRITVYSDAGLNCPPPISVQCPGFVPAPYISPIAFIAAGGKITNQVKFFWMDDTSDRKKCPETIIRRYAIIDGVGDTLTCTQFIFIDDTENPVAEKLLSNLNILVSDPPPVYRLSEIDKLITDASVKDNCAIDKQYLGGPDRVRISITGCEAVWRYTYELRDLCGNTVSIPQQITIREDSKITVFREPAPRTDCKLPEVYDINSWRLAGGQLLTSLDVTMTHLPALDVLLINFCNGIAKRTYEFKTACGTELWTETIIMKDEYPPVFVQKPNHIPAECVPPLPFANYKAFKDLGGLATDNCGLNENSFSHLAGRDEIVQLNCPKILVRTYEIFDNCGLRGILKDTLTIIDTTPPTTLLLANLDPFNCYDDRPLPDVSLVKATDNCGETVTVEFVSDTGDPGCKGVVVRTYRITDICGNSATITQNINIDFKAIPVAITVPVIPGGCEIPPIYGSYKEFYDAGGRIKDRRCNNTAGPLMLEWVSDIPDGNTCPKTYRRTYKITDECGNVGLINQIFIIEDKLPPVIPCLPDISNVSYKSIPEPYTTLESYKLAAGEPTDNCGIEFFVYKTLDSTRVKDIITINRIYVVIDFCGNADTCFHKIIAIVDEPFALFCPDSKNSEVDCYGNLPPPLNFKLFFDNGGSFLSAFGIDTATFKLLSQEPNNIDCYGPVTRIYSITDKLGIITATCEHVILVNDKLPPEITCPPTLTVQVGDKIPDPLNSYNKFIASGGSAKDNCKILGTGPLNYPYKGEITRKGNCADTIFRTYYINDYCYRVDSCVQMIVVLPDIPFTFECPPTVTGTFECITDIPVAYKTLNEFILAGGKASSGSGIQAAKFRYYDSSAGSCPTIVTRTYEITDSCDKVKTCTQQFTVDDKIPPVIVGVPADQSISCRSDVPLVPNVTATDNCKGKVTIGYKQTITDSVCVNKLTITRIWTASDECNNTRTRQQIIRIDDNIAPWFVKCPPNRELAGGLADVGVFTGLSLTVLVKTITSSDFSKLNISVNDNCKIEKVTYRDSIYGICPSVVKRTFTVYDECGNTNTCVQKITTDLPVRTNFDPIGPLCVDEVAILQSKSKEGILGSWAPSTINTSVAGTYTFIFTPTIGVCAAPDTLIIMVTPEINPVFKSYGPYCINSSVPSLPEVSENGIKGKWAPALINTVVIGKKPYTFIPEPGQCAKDTTIEIEITDEIIPVFAFGPYCQNTGDYALSTISENLIKGTWLPAKITTAIPGHQIFTFTSDAGQCGKPVTISVNVMPEVKPVFDPVEPLCLNSLPPELKAISKNGIKGTWSPAVIKTDKAGTFDYIFNPDSGQCALPFKVPVLIVDPLPVSVGISANKIAVCDGDPVTFTASPVNGGLNPVFKWYVNGKEMTMQSKADYTYPPHDGDKVNVTMLSSINCVSGNPATSDTITITIIDGLVVEVDIAADTTVTCDGETVNFTATPINGGDNPVFTWFVNGVKIAGQTGPTFSFKPVDGDEVYVKLTSSEFCVIDPEALSDTITITVTDRLAVKVNILADKTLICEGETVTFVAIPENGGDNPVYEWYVNGILRTGVSGDTLAYKPANSDKVFTKLTSDEICVVDPVAVSNTVIITHTIKLIVSVTMGPDPKLICEGTPVTLTAKPVNGGLNPVYKWFVNNLERKGENAVTFTYTPKNKDKVFATLETDLVCVVERTDTSNVITVNVGDTIPPDAICRNITVYLDAKGKASITTAQINNGSNDNCKLDTLFLSRYNFGCADVGKNKVKLTAVDAVGLSNFCEATVTVLDTIKPVVVCRGPFEIQLDENAEYKLTVAEVLVDASDACGIDTMYVYPHELNCDHIGLTTITLWVVGVNGDSAYCETEVMIYGNRPPNVIDDSATTKENIPVIIEAVLNDYDEKTNIDISSLAISIKPLHGSVSINPLNGDFTYTPNRNFSGVDVLEYRICDDGIPCDPECGKAFVYITVEPVNEKPLAVDDYYDAGCFSVSRNVLDNDTDPDGTDNLLINTAPLTPPNHGSLIIDVDGTINYFPNEGYIGIDSFQYIIWDNGIPPLSDTAWVYISVDCNEENANPLDCELFIPEGFSPNEDGIHDFFRIMCIHNYPDAKLMIFNRNGNLLWEKENYGNYDVWGDQYNAWWWGTSVLSKYDIGKQTINGEPKLKVGNYVYVLMLGGKEVRSGTVMISY